MARRIQHREGARPRSGGVDLHAIIARIFGPTR